MQLFDLQGKVALVTGSTSGLGFSFARGLAQAGARVIINGNDPDKTHMTAKSLLAEGFEAYSYAFDVRNESELTGQIKKINQEVGGIDILVNNAAIQSRQPLERFSEGEFRNIVDVNLTGSFMVAKAVVQGMIRRQSGKIINITSMQSELSRESIAPYAASKGGLKMLTKAMTVEWAKHNIQINGIGPGYFITEMTGQLAVDDDFNSWLMKRTPAGRWGKPQELVGTVVYLASEASNFVNGQIIYVDGGLLAAI